jgi:TonB family protein
MDDIQFGARPITTTPTHRRVTAVVTVAVHVFLLAVVMRARMYPVRASSAGAGHVGIAAYVSGPVGPARASQPTAAPVDSKLPTIVRTAKMPLQDDRSDATQSAGAAGTPGGGADAGPIRVGAGGNLVLLNKVVPVYPPVMQSARVPGQVVLDAIIHRDGTIDDITVLRSTNDLFAQAAIAAVKKWRYTQMSFEAIVTVTVNFSLTG